MKIGLYGKIAVGAVKAIRQSGGLLDPRVAYLEAGESFTSSSSSREKPCPLGAFLGLCEDGFVNGVPLGDYGIGEMNLNKGYAVRAAKIVLNHSDNRDFGMPAFWTRVWRKVNPGGGSRQGQMHVVQGLLVCDFLQQP